MTRPFLIVALSSLLGMGGIGLCKPSQEVAIRALTLEPAGPVGPGETVRITVSASSADGSPLEYAWRADEGEIVGGQGTATATWRAPLLQPGEQESSAIIRVTVRHPTGGKAEKGVAIGIVPPTRSFERISHLVDVFKCCILSWDFLPVVLPAFLIAGAIPVFIPMATVIRYLGHRAKRAVAYGVASFSGIALSMCSCNVVPLAASILRRGAGLGPAYTFLYAGPAINFVTLVWTFQVVGVKMGLWRVLAVPLIAILTGLIMQLLFHREDRQRRREFEARAQRQEEIVHAEGQGAPPMRYVLFLFGGLMGILLLGGRGTPPWIKVPAVAFFGGVIAWGTNRWFSTADVGDWMRETWKFLKLVLPVLVPAILVIGLVQNNPRTWQWLHAHLYALMGDNKPINALYGALFGSLMYFPVLTEIPLVKALLKEEMIAVGPALAILLNGPGVSLPGAILLARIFGWKKTLVYEGLEVLLGAAAAASFGHFYGQYVCPCQQEAALIEVLGPQDRVLQRVPLRENQVLSIGSGRRQDLRIAGVAEAQARIYAEEGEFFFEDLDARTPSSVEGLELEEPHRLVENDVIQVGDHRLVYKRVDPGSVYDPFSIYAAAVLLGCIAWGWIGSARRRRQEEW